VAAGAAGRADREVASELKKATLQPRQAASGSVTKLHPASAMLRVLDVKGSILNADLGHATKPARNKCVFLRAASRSHLLTLTSSYSLLPPHFRGGVGMSPRGGCSGSFKTTRHTAARPPSRYRAVCGCGAGVDGGWRDA
jgi:hypothetical protein